jgi:quercetin dioxygenase-like cupin family protein
MIATESSTSITDRTETIRHHDKTLCIIVRGSPAPKATTFYTPNDFNLQVGNVVYPAGGEIPRHSHRQVERNVSGTSEVLVVQQGRMIVDLYTDDHKLVCSREVVRGDVLVLVAGGHGFRLIEDTVLLEVKQGPYSGIQEKDRF